MNLLKLIKLLNVIAKFIKENFKKPGQEIDPNDMLNDSNVDMLNIHKLIKYVKVSKVAYKIDTYMQSLQPVEEHQSEKKNSSSSQPLLFRIMSFLTSLSNPKSEGQFFFEKGSKVKYMLMEPSKQFQSILSDSKCVILAGGTMEPIQDFYDNLFPSVPKDQITSFSCDHVIPDSNLNTFILNEPIWEFTFEKRNDTQLINKYLFQFFIKLSTSVPSKGGIVVFFPSYQYLDHVITQWKSNGLFEKLNAIRSIFYESKDGVDPLSDYSETIAKNQGAILFAIVGGKLSEGINFQDDLCRAIVMTGLPYPNVFSGELLVKKKHLEEKILKNGGTKQDVNIATRNFFETICMKAVNQSVGRAIRHANDYANIYLLDKRYATQNIKGKLSHWVANRIQPQTTVDSVMLETRTFFKLHK